MLELPQKAMSIQRPWASVILNTEKSPKVRAQKGHIRNFHHSRHCKVVVMVKKIQNAQNVRNLKTAHLSNANRTSSHDYEATFRKRETQEHFRPYLTCRKSATLAFRLVDRSSISSCLFRVVGNLVSRSVAARLTRYHSDSGRFAPALRWRT